MRNLTLFSLILIFGCSSPNKTDGTETSSNSEVSEIKQLPEEAPQTYTQDDQENIQRLIQMTLNDAFKQDLDLAEIDSIGRKYIYDQVDLNNDGKKELLIGLIGPYFCGSGGCTVLLTTGHGDIITKFTVSDYPFYVDQERSNGWNNLVIFSGGENRLVRFDGQKYPSNPSVLESFQGDLDDLEKLLEWEAHEVFLF